MKKWLVALCGGLLAAGFSGCNEGGTYAKVLKSSLQQSKLAASQQVASDFKSRMALRKEMLKNNMEPTLNLGDGFDSRTGIGMANNCLANAGDPEAIQLSNPHATIDFSRTVSSEQVGDFLHTNVNGNANFGVFSMSANANYTRNSTDTRQSIHFNYLQTMAMDATYKAPGIGNKILSTDAQTLLEGGMNDFTDVCGDSIIQSGKMGALLLVDASFDFASAAAKESFDASVGTSFTFGSANASMQKVSEQTRKNSKFSIRVLQLGGDPTKLANIFKETGGNFHVLSCSPENADVCDKVAGDVIRYAQNDFQTSVDFKKRDTLWMYDYATKPWSKLAVKAQLPILTDEQIAAREYLTDTITQDRRMLQYLQTYQHQAFFGTLNTKVIDNVNQIIFDYQKMINDYNNYQIIDSCYGDTENINTRCIYAADQVRQMHTKYQSSINIANTLANTILATDTKEIGNAIKLIPISTEDFCDGDINNRTCYGLYISYISDSNSFTPIKCIVDTTESNNYMKQNYNTKIGKSVFCFGHPWNPNSSDYTEFFIKRFNNYSSFFGGSGYIYRGIEYMYRNDTIPWSKFSYSDSTDFKYSPI